MKYYRFPDLKERAEIIKRPQGNRLDIRSEVEQIIKEVQERGDSALRALTKRFDGVDKESFCVSKESLLAAQQGLDPALKAAIEISISNIRKFHGAQLEDSQRQMQSVIETTPGVFCSRLLRPIGRVGLYVPGGTAPLFSTLLMLAIPAVLAGCNEIVVVTPPGKASDQQADSVTLAVASMLGISEVCQIGGAQAIAALAFGTETIRPVDKIFGPGNSYVDLAKQIVATHKDCKVAIDLPAGPSEVCIVADRSSRIDFVVADLLAQAEHGGDSQVLLLTDSEEIIDKLEQEISRQLESLPRCSICQQALVNSSAVLLTDLEAAVALSNEYAPEHLILSCRNSDSLIGNVTSAGSVFVGELSAEVFGDYASGTNHVLPTAGWAKVVGGVSVASFQKWITVQKLSQSGADQLAGPVALMARAEGLEAHARAAEIRVSGLLKGK